MMESTALAPLAPGLEDDEQGLAVAEALHPLLVQVADVSRADQTGVLTKSALEIAFDIADLEFDHVASLPGRETGRYSMDPKLASNRLVNSSSVKECSWVPLHSTA